MPRAGPPGSGDSNSFVSSPAIRSAETLGGASVGASPVMAARSPGTGVKPSCATNLAARSIRSGSSVSELCGRPGVRSTFWVRSRRPPKGSTNS